MNNGVPPFNPPYRQTTPKECQVEPATRELSLEARGALWQILLKPAVVEFYPTQPQKDQQRTHRTLFQDANFQWRRMNVFKDTFLTIDMTLPTSKIAGIGAGVQETTLISLPIRNLASGFYDVIKPDWRIGLEPLGMQSLPDLREFTMACPRQCDDGMSSRSKGKTGANGDWYGFRYHALWFAFGS
ncbi:hypothetical protein CEP54_000552 [Fusarium duplospermum]|uniref:Uncharacterized protein n=1 Tax=Fusarium duplospermum TaxID=1325734 RepID=A0A428R728_9HYPO|nr:hypothetical protein CEP54_000552 [Fusarium duplospermum]